MYLSGDDSDYSPLVAPTNQLQATPSATSRSSFTEFLTKLATGERVAPEEVSYYEVLTLTVNFRH